VIARAYAPYPLWVLGYPERALDQAREGLSMAKDLGHPHTVAWMLIAASSIHLCVRDLRAASELADSAMELSRERGFPLWTDMSRTISACILAQEGSPDERIEQVRRAIDALEAAGLGVWRPFYLSFVAVGCRRAGRAEDGLRAAEEALAFAERSGEHWFDGELHRLKGDLLLTLQSDRHAEAEACFRLAVDIARKREMKSFELRAAASLCRLLRSQGKRDEARQMLAEVYGWFTEGFDTVDLKEASTLLEELRR